MSGNTAAVIGREADSSIQSYEAVTDVSLTQRMLSATTGSLLTSLLVTPLDVVRVRLQSQVQSSTTLTNIKPASGNPFSLHSSNLGVTACCREVFWVNNNASLCLATPTSSSLTAISSPSHINSISAVDCAVDETRRRTFNSTYDGLRKIARNEGLLSLWRGLSPTLVMAIPANVIYFSGYDALRHDQRSPIARYIPENYAPLVAGAAARVSAAIAVSPIEMFRTRMQASSAGTTSVFKDTLSGLRDMVRAQGLTTLWRGLTLTMWRDVPFSGIYWWGYEVVRNRLTEIRQHGHDRDSDPSQWLRERSQSRNESDHATTFIDSFIGGAVSGAIASVVTAPFDVGKTRQQVFVHANDMPGSSSIADLSAKQKAMETRPENQSMPKFLYHIYKHEGLPGLFRGWAARCLKVAPACAIMISSYEIGKKMARDANEKRDART